METAACLNCGTELAGKWCSQCGQRAAEPRPTVHELLHEALDELGHFDSKFLRTAKLLLFKPGALTGEFLHGKRVHYVSPIRLYLICSLLFFGTIRRNKGLDLLLDTVEQLQGMHLTIAGEARESEYFHSEVVPRVEQLRQPEHQPVYRSGPVSAESHLLCHLCSELLT